MPGLPDDVRQLVEQAIVRSPYGKLLGLELVSAEPDRVRVKLPYRLDVTTLGETWETPVGLLPLIVMSRVSMVWVRMPLPVESFHWMST